MDTKSALTSALLLLAVPALADKPMGAVPGEAASLKEPARSAAMHVQKSHFEAFAAAFGTFTLTGVDWKDPSKPASCDVHVFVDPASLPPGSYVDGVPVRRAQPLWFNELQKQLLSGIGACAAVGKVAVTAQTVRSVRDRALDLLAALSGATYCVEDADCYVTRADASRCGGRPPLMLAGSNTTSAVPFIALRKFMPSLLSHLEQLRAVAKGTLGAKHPDPEGRMPGCERPMWEEQSLPAACVANRCRPKAP
jgi:hypothetical protein